MVGIIKCLGRGKKNFLGLCAIRTIARCEWHRVGPQNWWPWSFVGSGHSRGISNMALKIDTPLAWLSCFFISIVTLVDSFGQ